MATNATGRRLRLQRFTASAATLPIPHSSSSAFSSKASPEGVPELAHATIVPGLSIDVTWPNDAVT